MHEQVCLYQGHEAIPLADIISSVFPACADPNSTGPGRVLSQTQTEAQTGASHQSDVWKQLREGEGWMDWWIDGWGGVGRRMGEGEMRAFGFSELFKQSAELLHVGPNWQPQLQLH